MYYLDHAATTPVSTAVQKTIMEELQYYGNPSSTYQIGRTQKQKMEQVRTQILTELSGHKKDAIIFTASGSEANNLVFESIVEQYATQKGHIITTAIEHPSIKKSAAFAKQQGFEVTELLPNEDGLVSATQVKEALRDDTRLVSIMTVNNETGMIQPIQAIGEIVKDHSAYFHTDAVQAFAQEAISVEECHLDYLSASGHKINAPKGVGFLYKSQHAPIHSLIKGGGQEQGFRAGTENVPYIMGLGVAIQETVASREERQAHLQELGAYLYEQLEAHHIPFEKNGGDEHHSPHVYNVWLKGVPSSRTLILCDLAGVAISAGSACSAGSLEPSPVLTAMYPTQPNRIQESIRLSFGLETTKEEIDAFITSLSSLKF